MEKKELLFRCTFSAPNKIIISGEHSVNFGCLAIASAINQRTITEGFVYKENKTMPPSIIVNSNVLPQEFKIELTDICNKVFNTINENIVFNSKNTNNSNHLPNQIKEIKDRESKIPHCIYQMIFSCIEAIFSNKEDFSIIDKFIHLNHSLKLSIESDESIIGQGLGSSASFCLTLTAAFLKTLLYIKSLFTKSIPSISEKKFKEIVYQCAFRGENIIHSKSSGLDLITSLNGGILFFKKANSIIEFKFCQNRVFQDLQIIIINSNVKKRTSEAVSFVLELAKKDQAKFEILLKKWNEITNKIEELLTQNCCISKFSEFSSLVADNQKILEDLNLSIPEFNIIVEYN